MLLFCILVPLPVFYTSFQLMLGVLYTLDFVILSSVGTLGPGSIIYLYIGPMAQVEGQEWSEEEKSLIEETVLVNEEVGFGHNGQGGLFEDECVLG